MGPDDHWNACSDALATLYAAGARKFIVWQTPAGESVPLVNTINELLNMVNFVLRGLGTVDAQTNAVKVYTKGFVVSHCMTDLRLSSCPHPIPPGPRSFSRSCLAGYNRAVSAQINAVEIVTGGFVMGHCMRISRCVTAYVADK